MNILPVIVVGAAIALFGRKRRKRKPQLQLPPSGELGELFAVEDPPDIIATNVGKRFSVSHISNMSTGTGWGFVASPPDNSIELVRTEFAKAPEPEPGTTGAPDGMVYYIFEAKKIGDGSLVFHLRGAGGKDQPPLEVVEIETRIS